MPKRGENIYKRKDARWEGRYIKSLDPTGKARYGYVYARTYREVKAQRLQAQASARPGQADLWHLLRGMAGPLPGPG